MGHRVLIGGTSYEITGGMDLVGGTAFSRKAGKCLVGGTAYDIPFVHGTPVSALSVGSSIYLNEAGVPAEYLITHQGNPDSTLYDASCDGVWILRKGIPGNHIWGDVTTRNDYANSAIHSYLNNDYLSLLDANVQAKIKQVKLPYRADKGIDTTVTSGANGLSAKIFLLSGTEAGFVHSYTPASEGAKLDYFKDCAETSSDAKRVAYLDDTATTWWLRSPYCNENYSGGDRVNVVWTSGAHYFCVCHGEYGVRPAMILPYDVIVNEDLLLVA